MQSKIVKVGAKFYEFVKLPNDDFELYLAKKGLNKTKKCFIDVEEQLVLVKEGLKPESYQELLLHQLLILFANDIGMQFDDRIQMFISLLVPRLNDVIESGVLNDVIRFSSQDNKEQLD